MHTQTVVLNFLSKKKVFVIFQNGQKRSQKDKVSYLQLADIVSMVLYIKDFILSLYEQRVFHSLDQIGDEVIQ